MSRCAQIDPNETSFTVYLLIDGPKLVAKTSNAFRCHLQLVVADTMGRYVIDLMQLRILIHTNTNTHTYVDEWQRIKDVDVAFTSFSVRSSVRVNKSVHTN